MDGLPNYWGEATLPQEDFTDGTQPNLPPLNLDMPMTVWIPVYSPGLTLPPVVFQRANTAPVQYSAETNALPYGLSGNADADAWVSPGAPLQRSFSDPLWSNGAEVDAPALSPISPSKDDEQPKKELRKERRRSQNRKAQRAFRERKDSRLRELEEELACMNAKYNTLEREHECIKGQLLAILTEKEELEGTTFSPSDTCSLLSPEACANSRRTSLACAAAEALLNDMHGERDEERSPQIGDLSANLPSEAST